VNDHPCRVAADLARKDWEDEQRLDELEQKQERIDQLAQEMMVSAIRSGDAVFWESLVEMSKIDELRLQAQVVTTIQYISKGELEKRVAHELLGEFMLNQITDYIYPIMQETAQDELT